MLRRAAEFYQGYFSGLGYDSEIRVYRKTSGYITYDVLDVVAFRWGQEYPDEWIVVGGHYDIVRRSIEGAYDNAAGSCAVLELADGFADLTTSRTVVFCLWDGEEEGLWGSNFFAQDIPPSVDVKAYLNFDMVGLNWPLPYELLVLVGPDEDPEMDDCPDLLNIARNATFNYLGYPSSGVDIHESSGGGSDHLSFQNIGTQTYFFYGNSPYIQYHRRTDLLADMVAYAGSRSNLEQGFETVAWIAFYITILIDNNDTLHQEKPEVE
jgi:Zn-dependent M28 family amino/carboxypeptidase